MNQNNQRPVETTDQTDELRKAVREMTRMLEEREWAEHVSNDPDATALESEITNLVGLYNDLRAKVQPVDAAGAVQAYSEPDMKNENKAAQPVEAAGAVQAKREKFEVWAKRTHRRPGTTFARSHSGDYVDNRIAAKWVAWKAAWATAWGDAIAEAKDAIRDRAVGDEIFVENACDSLDDLPVAVRALATHPAEPVVGMTVSTRLSAADVEKVAQYGAEALIGSKNAIIKAQQDVLAERDAEIAKLRAAVPDNEEGGPTDQLVSMLHSQRSRLLDENAKLRAALSGVPAVGGALVASDGLLPCPFCGSTNIDRAEWSGNDGDSGPGCGDCGALADSVELWNRRAAPATGALVASNEPTLIQACEEGNDHESPSWFDISKHEVDVYKEEGYRVRKLYELATSAPAGAAKGGDNHE